MQFGCPGHEEDIHVTGCCFFQAEDGIRDVAVTGVQTCALPISTQPFFAQPSWVNFEKKVEVMDNFSKQLGNHSVKVGVDYARLPTFYANLMLNSPGKIGRASCRERGKISVVAVSLKKKKRGGGG